MTAPFLPPIVNSFGPDTAPAEALGLLRVILENGDEISMSLHEDHREEFRRLFGSLMTYAQWWIIKEMKP